jgi:hypothetical protein
MSFHNHYRIDQFAKRIFFCFCFCCFLIALGMDFHHLFEIDSRHKILICKGCQYAIIPSHFKTHLQVYHPRLTLQQRRDFV